MFTVDYDDILAHEAALEARLHDCGQLIESWSAKEDWCPGCEVIVAAN